MSLQDKLDAYKADFEANKAPPAVVAVMRRATQQLIDSGQADRALKAGARAPEFSLVRREGKIGPLGRSSLERALGADFLSRRLVSLLQYGFAGDRRSRKRHSRARRLVGRGVAANLAQSAQVRAGERAQFPDPQRPRQRARARVRAALPPAR